ncbi:MAG TPA: hypothetical protein VF194_19705 [Ferrovibrio sp.]|uniref:hypothetical protein n=1 Tax=Ferrovibrio sp. TaxID=1917215 RepID=UPI002ED351D1
MTDQQPLPLPALRQMADQLLDHPSEELVQVPVGVLRELLDAAITRAAAAPQAGLSDVLNDAPELDAGVPVAFVPAPNF